MPKLPKKALSLKEKARRLIQAKEEAAVNIKGSLGKKQVEKIGGEVIKELSAKEGDLKPAFVPKKKSKKRKKRTPGRRETTLDMKKRLEELERREEKINRVLTLQEILTDEQMQKYKEASEPRKKWLEEFIRCGNSDEAAKAAYPNQTQASLYRTAYVVRTYFDITVQDLYRGMGITEMKIVEKVHLLLDAKKRTRTYKAGEESIETEEEDTFAISKGIEHSAKMLKIDPGQKILHGEDKDNPFTSLADAAKGLKDTARNSTLPTEAPE